MNIEDIATINKMDVEALTERLNVIPGHYAHIKKRYETLPTESTYNKAAENVAKHAHNLKTALAAMPPEMRSHFNRHRACEPPEDILNTPLPPPLFAWTT